MNHDDKYLKGLDFPKVKEDLTRIPSLSSLNLSTHSLDGDLEDSKDLNGEIWLPTIQLFEDLLIASQKKFKTYEGGSEYFDCSTIKVSSRQSWKSLSPSEIEVAVPILTESFKIFFKDLFQQTRNMDTAVLRLRQEISDMKIKQTELNKHGKRFDRSAERPFQTIGNSMARDDKRKNEMIEDLRSEVADAEKKCKRLETRNIDLKKELAESKKDLSVVEAELEMCSKKNMKQKREIKELKEFRDPTNEEDIDNLKKQVKDLQRDLKMKESEMKEERDNLQKNISKGLDLKLDRLIAEKELKGSGDSDDVEDFNNLKKQVKDLQKELKMQKDMAEKLDRLLVATEDKDSRNKNDGQISALEDKVKQFDELKKESLKKDYSINVLKEELKRLTELKEENLKKDFKINLLNGQIKLLIEENSAKNDEINGFKSQTDQLNALRNEIEKVRKASGLNEQRAIENCTLEIESLREQIDVLQKRIFSHEKEMIEQKTCYQCKERDLIQSVNEMKEQSDQQLKWLHSEVDSAISKVRGSSPLSSGSAQDGFWNSLQSESMKTGNQNLIPLSCQRDPNRCDDQESIVESLLKKISENEELLKKKSEAISTMRDKLGPLLEDKFQFDREKNDFEIETTELKEELKKKSTAISNMTKKISENITIFEEYKKKMEKRTGELEEEIVNLKKEIEKLKEENEKKQKAVCSMKEKIKILNGLTNTADELKRMTRQYDDANNQIKNLEGQINSLKNSLRENRVERENLRKEKIRMESEMENMKKLNFLKKTGSNV